MLDAFQILPTTFVSLMYSVAICLFIEISMYSETFNLDIKSLFSQMDLLTKSDRPELAMLKYCKEAVDFHKRIYQ